MGTNDPDVHHVAPRCLISLHEKANGSSLDGEGIQAWLQWEWEATRWRVPVEISREDLEALRPAVVLATRPQKVGPDRTGGARGCEGSQVISIAQGEAVGVQGRDIVSKRLRIVFKARRGR